MKRYITLPNGHRCGLPTYCKAWRTLKALKPEAQIKGWDYFGIDADRILRDIRYGVHARINRHISDYGHGRKWDDNWQRDMSRAGRDLNTPRLIISWLPEDIRERFAHRLRVNLCD